MLNAVKQAIAEIGTPTKENYYKLLARASELGGRDYGDGTKRMTMADFNECLADLGY
jgi:hypothetical protein